MDSMTMSSDHPDGSARHVDGAGLPDERSVEGVSGRSADLAALLDAAAAGDEDAWRELVDLYARRVFALCRSRCGRSDLAEEITQSVFATVATKLTSGAYSERGRFESWLFRVAMNRVRDEIRRSRRHAEPTDPDVLGRSTLRGGFGGDGLAEESARRADLPVQLSALREAMTQLSDADREVVELRHHAGLSFRQIADLLAEPLGTLLARHHRALRKLKDAMTASNPSLELEGAGE